nr:putative ubiquitin-like protein FUBI-like protein ENSP00000310146 [Vulpes vulpes]
MQLLVRAWELHTLDVTGLEAFAHIKAKTHVASLEGHTTEDKVVLLAGSPLRMKPSWEDLVTVGLRSHIRRVHPS